MTTRLVILCGMPRSASTWIGRALNSHPQISVFGESDYWGRSFIQPTKSGYYDASHVSEVVAEQSKKSWSKTTGDEHGELGESTDDSYHRLIAKASSGLNMPTTPAKLYLEIAESVADERHAEIVIDKTPGHLLFMDRIRRALPDGIFIVLSREPLGFIASLTHRKEGKRLLDAPFLRRLAYHPALTVILWRRYARALLKARRNGSDRILFIDYREISIDPVVVLEKVYVHLMVTPDRSWTGSDPVNSSFKNSQRSGPPCSTSYWLKLLAANECSELYPDIQLVRCKKRDVTISWLLLVPSVFSFLLYAPRPTSWFGYFFSFLRSPGVTEGNEK